MMLDYLTYAALALLVIIFLSQAIRILREYERGVVFTLGRFTGVKGPGLIILIPVVQQLVKVDLRVMVQVVPPQDVISRDNVSVKVNALLSHRRSRALHHKGRRLHGRNQPARANHASLGARQARTRRDARRT